MPGSIKALRLIHLLIGGGLTGAQLNTELGNALKAGSFEAALRQRTVAASLKASTAALTGLGGSAIALNAIFRQDMTLFDSIIANSGAAAAMAASAAAMGAVVGNATARTKLVASVTAMTAVVASATAMATVAADADTLNAIIANGTDLNMMVASATAMNAVATSATAMGIIAASNTAMTACLGNTVARNAFYNSDVALTAISNSATAKAAMRAAPTYQLINQATTTAAVAVGVVSVTGPCLMVGWSCSSTGNVTLTGRRAGSAVGSLTAVSGAITGTTAAFDNVMALTSPATVANTQATRTHFFGIVPV